MRRLAREKLLWVVMLSIIATLGMALLAAGLLKDVGIGDNSPLRRSTLPPIKSVFMIIMENKDWSSIRGSASASYINQVLLPMASYANQYFTPPELDTSLPNYLWLEAGTNFGISTDRPPSIDHQNTPNHLVTLMERVGYSWKAYLEGISGTVCPVEANGLYVPRHNPTVYFNDVTDTNNLNSRYCIAHERPFNELATDLHDNAVANYNLIVPNLCDDMHNSTGCQSADAVKNGDTWLSINIPNILSSRAYQRGGLLLITWDEGTRERAPGQPKRDDEVSGTRDAPIGLIALSPYAKGHGYSDSIYYTHSSTLLTLEEIFGVAPFLGGAAHATDLGDLFLPALPRPLPSSTLASPSFPSQEMPPYQRTAYTDFQFNRKGVGS